MEIRKVTETGERTLVAIFSTGEDPMAGLLDLGRREGLGASSFTAIGAFRRAVLGFFDIDRKDYRRIPVEEQCEVVSLTGNLAMKEGEPELHIHAVLGRPDGTAVVGHLLEAEVRPTLEVVLTELPGHLARRRDPATGLFLLAPSKP